MAEKEKFIHGYHENGVDIPGCISNGISEQDAETIYGQMVDFAKYAFNKSHAACYAAISMETAYLKCHYPVEFAAGLLTSVMDKTDKLAVYTADFRRNGVRILNPDINSSEADFSVSGSCILYGLASIKNAGSDIIRKIVEERKKNGLYKSLSDFVKRNPDVNKRMVESLIKAGAFDFLGKTRNSLLIGAGPIVDGVKNENKNNVPGQMSFFDLLPDGSSEKEQFSSDHLPDVPEFPELEKLRMEKQAAGFYLSGHPVEMFSNYLSRHNVMPLSMFQADPDDGTYQVDDRAPVITAGIITDVRIVFTKKDNRPMAFITIEDSYGPCSVVIFPDSFARYSDLLVNDRLIILYGKAGIKDGRLTVSADQIGDLSEIGKDLCIKLDSMEMAQNDCVPFISKDRHDRGFQNIYVFVKGANERYSYKQVLSSVDIPEDLVSGLENRYGKENVMFWK